MIPLTAEQLAEVVGGDLLAGADPAAAVDDVVIDSRRARPGSLFVALPGERTDGHAYLADAVGRGAVVCMVDGARAGEVGDTPGVAVDDCGDALLGLGRWARDTVAPQVVAITGSSGKTTTKDLLAAALGASRDTVATPGSYNNELGVPLTCCALTLTSEVLVAEVGARGVGHVAALAALLRPEIAVVTMIGGAHLEQFGSLEGVAQAKGELVEALDADGVAVLNADDRRVAALAQRTAAEVVTYGLGADADWRAEDVTLDQRARARFRVRGLVVALPMPGAHHVGNALAALAAADAVGVDLSAAVAGLARARLSPGRSALVETPDGVTVLDDTYNANPASMAAALRALAGMAVPGRRWAVLGRMAELGPTGVQEHERIGELAAELGVDALIVVGEQARPIAEAAAAAGLADLVVVEGPAEALSALGERLLRGDAVLVKASRAAGLERVADGLVSAHGSGAVVPAGWRAGPGGARGAVA